MAATAAVDVEGRMRHPETCTGCHRGKADASLDGRISVSLQMVKFMPLRGAGDVIECKASSILLIPSWVPA